MSSFEEAVAQVYDDSGLAVLMDAGRAEAELPTAIVELRRLRGALRSVDPYVLPVRDLIQSASMENVRSIASAAILALNKDLA